MQKKSLLLPFLPLAVNGSSSGEIPSRAVDEGLIGRFGYIDSLQGGYTGRSNIIARLSSTLSDNWFMQNQVYYSWYHFNHRYNDTFFADDSVNGDRLRQAESTKPIWI